MRPGDWRLIVLVSLVVAINIASCINRQTLRNEYAATAGRCSEVATLCEVAVLKCEGAVDLLTSAVCQELP